MNTTNFNSSINTAPTAYYPNDLIKRKESIVGKLLKKMIYEDARDYAKENIAIIKKHQSTIFTSSMPHSLKYTLLHLANLKFGFEVHSEFRLKTIFIELFNKSPNNVETKQLKSLTTIGAVGNSRYTKYKNLHDYMNQSIDLAFENKKFSGSIMYGLYKNGKITYPNGSSFEGKFAFKVDLNYQEILDGDWWCYGTLTYVDGKSFTGTFMNDRIHEGSGTVEYSNGDIFQGEYL